MHARKKRWLRRLRFILVSYLLIGTILYFVQELLLFHPDQLSRRYQYYFPFPFRELDIPFPGGDTINLVKFFPNGPINKGLVLYFHGNMENINRYAKFTNSFTRRGFEVWMEDYPGFGKSLGNRSEENLNKQAMEIYQRAVMEYSPEKIIIFGKSLGTGIAACLAAHARAKRLILETPYSSIPSLFSCYAPIYPTSLLSHYQFPTGINIQSTRMPVTIFQGTADAVVPYYCAAELKKNMKPGDEFVTIEGGTHHNLNDFLLFQLKLDSILRN